MLVNIATAFYTLCLWPVVASKRFFDPATWAGSDRLAAAFGDVRDEYLALRQGAAGGATAIDPAQSRLDVDRGWRVLMLRLYGRDGDLARRACPRTAALIDELPDVTSALFSVLEPRTRLRTHPGLIKGVLRVHLALVVPEGDCGIEVGGQQRTWEPGGVLVFDDTYPHRVWNDTDEPRVVLFLDVLRPMPWAWLDRLNRRVIAALGRTRRVDGVLARSEASVAAA